MRGLLFFCLLSASAFAQADLPDAGLPDASVGGTGAERASEEEDNGSANSSPCLSDSDCDNGFQCLNSKCSYRRYRDATFEGCATGSGLSAVLLAALWLRRRRHFLANFTK
jgi:hypothetical protein